MADRGLILVTGGAGFIGSHLVEALLADGHPVRVADNLSTGRLSNLEGLSGSIEIVEGDLSDFDFARRAARGAHYVFHQAAVPSVPRSVEDPLGSHSSGPTATLNVLEAARQAGTHRVMFAASSSAYGDTETLPKTEDMLPRPLSPYAAGKLAGESYIHVYARTMGLDGVSLRYFNVFGPRQDPSSPYSGVISQFASKMMRGEAPTVLGDGHQTRDFTYVENVVQANLLAMKHQAPLNGLVLNVGTGRQVSLRELVDALNSALGSSLVPSFGPPRKGDVLHSLASLKLLETTLGYRPRVDFETGIMRTVASLQEDAK
ncbi:MAG TPA: SDR family oxidoreductase [Isosphaeraceae bacterium]|nr:SDR family oxidoreductase [Isosphaeraceae bacterium]